MRKTVQGILLSLIILLPYSVKAQFFEYNHSEIKWRTFETEHFVIHFYYGTERSAFLVAQIAEDIYPHVTGLYNYRPKKKVHFIIKDIDDYSNGGSFFFDNKIEIWASNLDYIMRGTKNWLRDVVTHEFTHMVSIQAMEKTNNTFPFGFFQLFAYEKERRRDVVRGFPNVIVSYPLSSINLPVWFAEGTAQHQADSSRYDYRDAHREMILRDRILSNRLLTLNEMSVFGKGSNGNESSYNQGFSFVNYLSDRFGEHILEKIAKTSAKWSSYTFRGVVKSATGVDIDTLYHNWKDSLETVYTNRTRVIRKHLVTGDPVETEGDADIYPIWSPDGKKIAYISNQGKDYFGQNFLVVYDLKSGFKEKKTADISSSITWSPDGRYIAYARQVANMNNSKYRDIFLYDLEKDKEIRLTKGLRGSNPDFSHDGKKIVFISETNGLNQLNIYKLPENLKDKFSGVVYFNIETGVMQKPKPQNLYQYREVKFRSGLMEQLMACKDSRQIYHPRWFNGDKKIIFDTAISYGRNLGQYDLQTKKFSMFMSGKEELRYPVFQPGKPILYYSSSATGITNIYRYNLETGEKEIVTNVTGGAMMPAVDAQGNLVYACYEEIGYHIFKIDNPRPVPQRYCVYQQNYLETVPDKNYDDSVVQTHESAPYKRKFTGFHILPRILIDYGTFKPGLYLTSSDVLNKYNLVAGAAVNFQGDYDLYGYFDIKTFSQTLFIEAYNSSASIQDSFTIDRGYKLHFEREANFNLTEVRIGMSGRIFDKFDYSLAWVYSNYEAKLDPTQAKGPDGWIYIPVIRYRYLNGNAIELNVSSDMIKHDRNSDISPSGGRFVHFKYGLEFQDFLDGFATDRNLGLEQYTKYKYNLFSLEWEEYFKNPFIKNHSLSVRFKGGYIDRPIDSFFYFYAGGILGMRGYSYYAIGGLKKLIVTGNYRFPIFNHIDKKLGHLYFDKFYVGLFYDWGNAWDENKLAVFDFKQDVGLELRLSTFSFNLFPTKFFFEMAWPMKKARYLDVQYPQEIRYYFGALFEFDLRERVNGMLSKSHRNRLF